MKKLLSIMLAALIALSCLVVPVYAEGPIKFDLVITSGTYVNDGTGAEITADVVVSNIYVNGYTGAILNITIPDGLALVNPSNPTRSVSWKAGAGEPLEYADAKSVGMVSGTTNVLALGFGTADYLDLNGAIATIRFVVADEATLIENDFGLKLEVKQLTAVDSGEHLSTDPDFAQFVTYPTAPVEAIDKEQATKACKHPETEKVAGQDPTCTEPGYSAGEKCKFCGAALGNTQQTPALGHDWQFDSHKVEASCSKEGIDVYKCTRCGETEERPVGKTAHTPSTDYKHDDDSHWTYCTVCGEQIGDKEAHTPDTAWHNEDATVDGHYHICSVCKAAVGVEEHVDEDADGVCDICDAALHEHVADTSKWLYDDEGHYHACTVPGCKAKLDKAAHDTEVVTTKEATCTEKGIKTTTCTVCDYEKTEDIDMIPHTPDEVYHTEEGSAEHWHVCTVCGNKIDETATAHTYGEYTATETEHTHVCTACGATETAKHTGGTATCNKQAVCEVCGTSYGELDATNHADGIDEKDWKSDETNHWHVCKNCGEITDVEAHKESSDCKHDGANHWRYCTVCGYEYEKTAHATTKGLTSDSTGHWKTCDECEAKFEFDPHTKAILVSEKEATAEADGNTEYWYCPDCQKYFYNDNGKIGKGPYDNADEFTVKFKQTCQGNHDFICVPVNDAYHKFVCRRCGYSISTQHDIAANGLCFYCGHRSTTVNPNTGVVEVESPTEFKISAETLEIVR